MQVVQDDYELLLSEMRKRHLYQPGEPLDWDKLKKDYKQKLKRKFKQQQLEITN